MACSNCDGPKVFARGLCSGCYHRLRRRGTVARKNVVNQDSCREDGCERQAFSKNLCSLHYQRAQHPIYSTWQSLRSRARGEYPACWDRLDAFLAEVGERPSPSHRLRRPDPELPWSTTNMVWRQSVGVKWKGNTADYQWRWHLRNRYGITVEQVEEMSKAQGGKCATCPQVLGAPGADGKPMRVCVDHDHVTRAVRGLLCDPCNKGIGHFNDDIDRLRRAADYLEFHKAREAENGNNQRVQS